MTRRLVVVLWLFAFAIVLPSRVSAEADARDYEGLALAPNNTVAVWNYLRHVSGGSLDQNLAIFRATYVVHVGHLAFTPFDAFVPVTSVTAYTPPPMAPTSPAKLSIHRSGFADLVYLPSILYSVTEDEEKHTHTYFGLTTFITVPTGNYSTQYLINPGENRWSVKPNVVFGQRFLKYVTLEAMFNVSWHGDNKSFRIPNLGVTTLKQKLSYGSEVHLAVDLHPSMFASISWYMAKNGTEYFYLPPAAGGGSKTVEEDTTVHSLRFNWGIHVEKQTLLMLQMQQDVKAQNASITRYFGARISHYF